MITISLLSGLVLGNVGEAIKNVGGGTIAFVGYLIVFIALIVLVCIFTIIPRILNKIIESKNKKVDVEKNLPNKTTAVNMDAQTNAAIAAAIHLYFDEMHDVESNVITIKTAKKQYSPWNSKIYGVMNQNIIR